MTEKKRVLIVDDHPLMREALAQLIGKQRDLIVCGEAATAEDAKRTVETDAPDVVILDLMLGDSDGLDLIKFFKALAPQVAVLVISMQSASRARKRALMSPTLSGWMSEVMPSISFSLVAKSPSPSANGSGMSCTVRPTKNM